MHTLHRHIFRSVLFTCAAAVGLFAFVLVLGNAMRDLLAYALTGQLPPEVVVQLLLLLLPYVLTYALPMGVLTGVLLVLGRMSAQQEITAMRAAGLSLWYVARPVLIFGLAGMTLALGINYYYMPEARAAYRKTLATAVRLNPLALIVPRTFIRDFPGAVVYVGEKQGAVLRDFWLWQLDDQKRVTQFVRARGGRFDFDELENKLVLTLTQVTAETRDQKNPENFSAPQPIAVSDQLTVDLRLDRLFGEQTGFQRKPSWMTLEQLIDEQARLDNLPPAVDATAQQELAQSRMKISLSLHEKASGALAVLVFAFLAVPLGIKVSRKETSANLAIALLLVMGYYFLTMIAGGVLAGHPELRPDLLLWVPPGLFLLLGAGLFRRAGRV
jgi:lipopolysaccharide export system permease protein